MIGASFTPTRSSPAASTPAGRSTRRSARASSTSAVVPAALGIFITGFSSILTGLNFIVTIHRMRAPGMTWFRLPLFVWSHYATSLIMVLGTPVIAITLAAGGGRADVLRSASSTRRCGGDPVLFQHLFWFYSHPAVYIMVLPAMGVVSELVAAFCRKQVFGYTLRRVRQPRHRRARLPGLGPPHVRRRPVGLRRADLLAPQLPRRHPLGDQGLQLDRDAVQRVDFVGDADALRHRLHRAVHHRRADRAVPRGRRPRRARHRHLLHRRALPLHHGRRHDHGLPRRPALLVAEDHRPDVQRAAGQGQRGDHLLRLQPDLLPAVHRSATSACRGATTPIRRSSRC